MNQKIKITEIFSREEIKTLTTRSDWYGAWAVGSTWAVLALTFTVLAYAQKHLPI